MITVRNDVSSAYNEVTTVYNDITNAYKYDINSHFINLTLRQLWRSIAFHVLPLLII